MASNFRVVRFSLRKYCGAWYRMPAALRRRLYWRNFFNNGDDSARYNYFLFFIAMSCQASIKRWCRELFMSVIRGLYWAHIIVSVSFSARHARCQYQAGDIEASYNWPVVWLMAPVADIQAGERLNAGCRKPISRCQMTFSV